MKDLQYIIIIAVVAVVLLTVFSRKIYGGLAGLFVPPERKAGLKGERMATSAIKGILQQGDRLITNAEIVFEDMRTEMDNVIVNRNGVFIVEVKYFIGTLSGNEEDFRWAKYKTTAAGNVYEKEVKNPIRQVKRQIYILANFLKERGVSVYIRGYAWLINGNSPVEHKCIVGSIEEIDEAIHTPGRRMLNDATVNSIYKAITSGSKTPKKSD